MSDLELTPAPGAKAAKVCGILAIVFALTCVGIPVAIVLGIVALVQHGKARRVARTQPDIYEPVTATGLVTGIIGLVLPVVMIPFAGIVSAIAIPALLVQRERSREVIVRSNLNTAKARAEAALLATRTKAPEQTPSQYAIIQALSVDPAIQALKNPVTPAAPALQHGTSGPLGTVMVYADQAQEGGVTTWSVQFRVLLRQGGEEKTLSDELIIHTQEQAPVRLPDAVEEVPLPQPTPEPPVPQN